MSEHTRCNHDPDMPDELRPYVFIGSKLANSMFEDMPGNGVDDQARAVLTDILATGLSSGIILGLQGRTDDVIVQEQISNLQEQVTAAESPALTSLIPTLVTRGIHFYRKHVAGEPSPQVQSWLAEFALLRSAETEA